MERENTERRFGPYILIEELGRGNSGVVFEALHTETGQAVALKVLTETLGEPSPAKRERFQREARSQAAVSHPAVPKVLETGVCDGHLYIAREFFPGRTLRDLLNAEKRLPTDEALRLTGELLSALDAIHAQNIIHRDLKPENLIQQSDGMLRILDFGAAHDSLETALTQTGEMIGTPAYMSPEQIKGQTIDARSDLFAVGVLLHELLTGVRPFPAERVLDQLRAIESAPPRLSRDLPPNVRAVLEVALQKESGERFASAREMADALNGEWPRRLRPDRAPAAGVQIRRPLPQPVAALLSALPLVLLVGLFSVAVYAVIQFAAIGRKLSLASVEARVAAKKTTTRLKTATSVRPPVDSGGGGVATVRHPSRVHSAPSAGRVTRPPSSYPPPAYSPRVPAGVSASVRHSAPPSASVIPVAYRPCDDCGGTGKQPDPNCQGTGKCQTCDGRGHLDDKCIDCEGTGFARCYACLGSGMDRARGAKCRTCHGTGKASCLTCRGKGYRICILCNGTGKCVYCDGKGGKRCHTCSGTGRIRI